MLVNEQTRTKLASIDTELIGNGGNSRLSVMLNLVSRELWLDEWFDHESNSWKEYDDNIVCVGTITNGIIVDEDGVKDEDGKCYYQVNISNNDGKEEHIAGDYYNDYLDIDYILEVIDEMFPATL